MPVPPHRSEGRRLGNDMGINTMHDHERAWGPAPGRRPARSDLTTRSLQGHEATYAAVGALVTTLQEMHARATRRGLRMTLVAVGVSNAADIADAHGAGTLEHVTETVVRRGMGAGVELRPLRISPLGGALAVLLSPPLRAEESADLVAARMRGQVWTTDDDIWPVVTLGLRAFSDEDRAGDLLRDVRATLLDAARRRPGGVQWFRPEVLSRPGQDLALLRDLAQALERPEQIALAYQPVRCLATGRTRAVEALLRWTHPARGPVPALAAVAAAERSGLVHRLGALVLDQALAAAAGCAVLATHLCLSLLAAWPVRADLPRQTAASSAQRSRRQASSWSTSPTAPFAWRAPRWAAARRAAPRLQRPPCAPGTRSRPTPTPGASTTASAARVARARIASCARMCRVGSRGL